MTSKNLFFKLIIQDFKKRIWCPLLIFIAYFLILEVFLILEIETMTRYPRAHSYDIPTYVRDYFFGAEADNVAVFVCITAFVCAISGYAYLHSRKQLDTYHSLPVGRSRLFWSKYLSGILQFFIPFVIHVLICAGIAAGRNAFSAAAAFSMLSYLGLQLLIFVLSYSVSVIAVEITGNIIVSMVGTVVLFCYSTAIAMLSWLLSSKFFDTYIVYGSRVGGMINEKVWCFSPLSMLMKLFSAPDNTWDFFKYDASYIWVLAVAAVLYSMAAYAVYLWRASEAAGKTIAFHALEPVIKTMTVIPAAFFVGAFFCELSYDDNSEQWFLFGLVFGFILLCVLMEILFRMDIRGALMHKKQFLFNAACTALIFAVFRYDVLGYDTYVPADTQLQSCAVSIEQLMPLHQTIRLSNGDKVYVHADEYRMGTMEIQGNPSAMELARKAAKEGLAYRKFDYYEGIEGSAEYIETRKREESYRQISYGYKLLNGKTVYREYLIDIADADTIRLLSDIFNDYDYKMGSTPIFHNGWQYEYNVLRCESNFLTADIELTPDRQAKIIETYQAEYTKLSLDTVMNTIPTGTIEFVVVSRDNRDYYEEDYTGKMYVYPQFQETVALLETYGFDMEERLTADGVKSVSVTKNYDDEGNTYYGDTIVTAAYDRVAVTEESSANTVEYTDKKQIQQILDNIINDSHSWPITHYTDFYDRQYSIYVKPEDGIRCSYNYWFIKGQKPDFIQ